MHPNCRLPSYPYSVVPQEHDGRTMYRATNGETGWAGPFRARPGLAEIDCDVHRSANLPMVQTLADVVAQEESIIRAAEIH